MANLIGVLVARRNAGATCARRRRGAGLTDTRRPRPTLRFGRAFDVAGLGSDALRAMSADARCARFGAARRDRRRSRGRQTAVHADRDRGQREHRRDRRSATRSPASRATSSCGFTSTARSARSRNWRPNCAGSSRASSGPIRSRSTCTSGCTCRTTAGAVLVRDGALHAATFADHAPYLARTQRGTAARRTVVHRLRPRALARLSRARACGSR